MKCPACDVPLSMTDRQGIEIDYCPQCRGVWLDRGELDKIIDRTGAAEATSRPVAAAPPRHDRPPQTGYTQHGSPQHGSPQHGSPQHGSPQHGQHDYYRHKKKKNLLGELFDF